MKKIVKAASLTALAVGMAGSIHAQQLVSLTLGEMFEMAEARNRSLAVMDMAVAEAEEAIKVAKSGRLPDVEASLSVSCIGNANIFSREWDEFQLVHLPHFGNNFALEASQVIYSGGAVTAGVNMARLKHEMARLSRDEVRENVRMMLAGSYLQLYKLLNEQKVYEQNIVQTRKLVDEISAKHSQGVALKNDVTRYELN